jgi:hypothetical protein
MGTKIGAEGAIWPMADCLSYAAFVRTHARLYWLHAILARCQRIALNAAFGAKHKLSFPAEFGELRNFL